MAVPADITDADMLLYIRDAIRAVSLRQEYKGPAGEYLKAATMQDLIAAEQVYRDRVLDAADSSGGIALTRFGNAN